MAGQSHAFEDIIAAEALAPVHPTESKTGHWVGSDSKEDGLLSSPSSEAGGNVVLDELDQQGEVIVIPTEEEMKTLRRVADSVPIAGFLLVVVELFERFSWYGTTGPMTNFVQNPLPADSIAGNVLKGHVGSAGALGKGQRASTALGNFRQLWTYTAPIIGAILADTKWGRFNTIVYFFVVCMVGHIILVFVSIPSVIKPENSAGALAGFVISLVIMGLGTGGLKSNISPLVAEQYTGKMRKKTLPSGEQVIIDPVSTMSKLFMYYYLSINIGSLASLCTTFAEKHVGFWLAFSLPTFLFCVIPPILWFGWYFKLYKTTPPRGSVLVEAWRVFATAAKGKWSYNPVTLVRNFSTEHFWDTAKPSFHGSSERSLAPTEKEGAISRPAKFTWDDEFVDEVYRAVKACKVFVFYPLYWISYDQITSNLTSQASTMELHGVPNEIVNNLNPLSLVIGIPIFDQIIYPLLRRWKINFSPIKRITVGFMFGALAMAYTAIIQHYIYKTGSCGKDASACLTDEGDQRPSPLNVWLQAPSYILIGISEIFASITGLEYAFTKAPERMKSVVMSIYLLQSAIAAAIEFALVSVSADPYLEGMYSGIGGATFLAGIAFYITFRKLDADEDKLNLIGIHGREGFKDEKPAANVHQ